MNTLMLALRNLARNRRRSLTTLLAMAIGLVATLIFGGYRSNIAYGMETGFVQSSGHLQIQRKGYFLDGASDPTHYGIAGYERIIAAVRADTELAPMLSTVTPALQLAGLGGNFQAGISRSVLAIGVVVPEYNHMLGWNDYGIISYARPLPLKDTQTDAVVIGEGVARKLSLCAALKVPQCNQAPRTPKPAPGGADLPPDIAALSALEARAPDADEAAHIEMLAATTRGAPNVASLHVVQAKNMGIKAVDDVYMAMHLSQAQRLIYGNSEPQVTAISVQLKHTADLERARRRLEQLVSGPLAQQPLELLDFKRLNPLYVQSMEFMDSMFGFIAVLIGVIVLFTIGNTMNTAVVERTVEIGTLRAIGLNRGGLRRLFLCEGLLLGLCGSAVGLAAAAAVAFAINHSELTWTPPGYSYAYRILVLLGQDPRLIVGSIIGLIGVTLLSAWFPANRASKMLIVDALRHV